MAMALKRLANHEYDKYYPNLTEEENNENSGVSEKPDKGGHA